MVITIKAFFSYILYITSILICRSTCYALEYVEFKKAVNSFDITVNVLLFEFLTWQNYYLNDTISDKNIQNHEIMTLRCHTHQSRDDRMMDNIERARTNNIGNFAACDHKM